MTTWRRFFVCLFLPALALLWSTEVYSSAEQYPIPSTISAKMRVTIERVREDVEKAQAFLASPEDPCGGADAFLRLARAQSVLDEQREDVASHFGLVEYEAVEDQFWVVVTGGRIIHDQDFYDFLKDLGRASGEALVGNLKGEEFPKSSCPSREDQLTRLGLMAVEFVSYADPSGVNLEDTETIWENIWFSWGASFEIVDELKRMVMSTPQFWEVACTDPGDGCIDI